MKRSVLFLIIGTFLLQASIKTIVFIDWKLNQARITELYCVNKDNPMMHCNGKCYLSLKLKKIESDYEQSKAPFHPKHIKSADILLFFEKKELNLFSPLYSDQRHFRGGIYLSSAIVSFSDSCFRPPNLLSIDQLTA